MGNRKTGITGWAVLAGTCLAAVLGCGGKGHQSPPVITGISPAQAAVGEQVVITGYNFEHTFEVSFGSAPSLHFAVNGANQIVATVPPDANTYPVMVKNSGGQASSYVSLFVTPVIQAIRPLPLGAPSAGPGDSIQLTGQGLYGVSSFTFTGAANPVTPTWVSTNVLAVVVPADAAIGPVTLTFTVPGNVDPAVTVAATPAWTASADPATPGNFIFTAPAS